jgi:predicted MFS family arabinose efflux permease
LSSSFLRSRSRGRASAPERALSESKLLFLIGAVQFFNVLDFMMVMPLGPDLARAIGMPSSALGLVGGSYTAAAAVSGLVGSLFLDRFDRRRALGVALLGLVAATAAGGLSYNLPSLLAARVMAGIFGGPATAISLAMISDVVAPARRGRAMGAVMGAFSAASVLGVPAGLELARVGGWQLPFFAVAALGAVIASLVFVSLPPFVAHLTRDRREETATPEPGKPFFRASVLLALTATASTMIASFALIPNLSAYLQFNLGYPRERLGLLYLTGGAVSFATMRLSGSLSDRFGAAPVSAVGCGSFVLVLVLTFIHPLAAVPVLLLFTGFMVTSSFRMVPMQALLSRVPDLRERARFMSLQSAVQHMASAIGAVLSSQLLAVDAHGALLGIERVAYFSIALTLLLPVFLYQVQQRIAPARSAQAAVSP